MHLARIALMGVSVFCSSTFIPPFKFHFNNIRALLAVQTAKVHVFDVAVFRKKRRNSIFFRPVRKTHDTATVTVKPPQAARRYTHACPKTSYSEVSSTSELPRSFFQHSGQRRKPAGISLPQVLPPIPTHRCILSRGSAFSISFDSRYASRVIPLCAALKQILEQYCCLLLRDMNSLPQHLHLIRGRVCAALSLHAFEQYLAFWALHGLTSNIRPHCWQITIGITVPPLHAERLSPFPSGR